MRGRGSELYNRAGARWDGVGMGRGWDGRGSAEGVLLLCMIDMGLLDGWDGIAKPTAHTWMRQDGFASGETKYESQSSL